MKKKMEFHQPVDIFVCWWRHEELLLTAMQLVFNVSYELSLFYIIIIILRPRVGREPG